MGTCEGGRSAGGGERSLPDQRDRKSRFSQEFPTLGATPVSPRGKLSHGAIPGGAVSPLHQFTRNHLWKERESPLLLPTNISTPKPPKCPRSTQSWCSSQLHPAPLLLTSQKSGSTHVAVDNSSIFSSSYRGPPGIPGFCGVHQSQDGGGTGTPSRATPRARSCPFLGWRRR